LRPLLGKWLLLSGLTVMSCLHSQRPSSCLHMVSQFGGR
jgi:hypothetical protein